MGQVVEAQATRSPHWCTPPEFLELVYDVLGPRSRIVGLDPCSNEYSRVAAVRHWREGQADGLTQPWAPGTVYVNPPYSDIRPWAEKCRKEAEYGAEILLLVPASVDTAWFHDVVWPSADALCFLRGRVKFIPPPGVVAKHGPAFAPLVAYWGLHADRFEAVFGSRGVVW